MRRMVLAQTSNSAVSISDILWIILLLSAFQPVVQRYILSARRLSLIRRIERQRGSRVIALIHREETMSLLGFPIVRYITIQDSEEVLRAIRMTPPEMPIDIILHTPGGLVLAADQIAEALSRREGRVTAMVPHYAMSGGTLIALSTDEILMASSAVLGPVDPQLGQYPAASILAAVDQKSTARMNDQTLILADVAAKAIWQVRETVRRILEANGMDVGHAQDLAELLSTGKWTHDFPLNLETLKSLRLPASEGLPNSVFQLMALYPQPMRGQPSVEYVPAPYRDRGSRSNRGSSDGR